MPSSYVIGELSEPFFKSQIQQGRYASANEVIRDGVRALEDREKLRAAKLEGPQRRKPAGHQERVPADWRRR